MESLSRLDILQLTFQIVGKSREKLGRQKKGTVGKGDFFVVKYQLKPML